MKTSYIDTNIIIRLLTKDNPNMFQASTELFRRVRDGKESVIAHLTVIFEVVYVLKQKEYSFPRTSVRDALSQIIKLPGFKLENKTAVLGALDIYASSNLDFADSILISTIRESEISEIYTFDHDFDKVEGIKRIEP